MNFSRPNEDRICRVQKIVQIKNEKKIYIHTTSATAISPFPREISNQPNEIIYSAAVVRVDRRISR